MALTVLVTRDVGDRYRGFLASAMLEIALGVYSSPHLSAGARERIWSALTSWHTELRRGAITLVYVDRSADGGMSVRGLGTPPVKPARLDGPAHNARKPQSLCARSLKIPSLTMVWAFKAAPRERGWAQRGRGRYLIGKGCPA